MKHLFPAPDMKRGTHAHEENRLVRLSHMLPGLLRSKATNVVICSIFACERQVSSRPEPEFIWPPTHSSCLRHCHTKQSLGAKGDPEKQAGHLAVRARALTISKEDNQRCSARWGIGQQDLFGSLSPDHISFIKGKYDESNLTNAGQHHFGEFLYGDFVGPQFCRPQTLICQFPTFLQIRNFESC